MVTRDEVGAYKPYLWEQSLFTKGPMFREWILTKVLIRRDVRCVAGVALATPFFSDFFYNVDI